MRTDRWAEATGSFRRVRRILRRHNVRQLPALSAHEQLLYLRTTDQARLHSAFSLALAHHSASDIVASSAEWVVNAKGVAQEALSERERLALVVDNPKIGRIARQLQSIRARLASLTISPPLVADKQEGYRAELDRLTQQERELSKQIARSRGEQERDDPWVELAEVRKALAVHEVLIEIARFSVFDFKAVKQEPRWQPARYAAWVIPAEGQGDVRLLDLGQAEEIDKAVADLRDVLAEAPRAIRDFGEPDADEELQQSLAGVAKLVLYPLLVAIEPTHAPSPQPSSADGIGNEAEPARHLILSPDGSLWLVPWAALALEDGNYAIEGHRISYLVSGRDLVLRTDRELPTTAPLVLADPDYGLKPEEMLTTTARLASQGDLAKRGTQRSATGVSTRWPRLEGTAAEARVIQPRLQEYCQAEPRLYLADEALEGVFKAVKSPRVVVLSTHGFFLPDQEFLPDERLGIADDKRPALTTEGMPLENPLLRCGLVLAGANTRVDRTNETADDGILTGLEIVGTDLRGTELVVLSACETGLGEVHNGEGVAGLRQAFQLAGARSVVASLWQVDDQSTARLMADFFTNLAAGQAKAEALRGAQLAMIRSRRERNGAAHPYFWAAFTLTGTQ